MVSQWENFLQNLGTWKGSFSTLGDHGQVLSATPSILSLEQGNEERLVHFRLRRFADQACEGEPIDDLQQDYRSLGRQVVFFETGTFCKGSLQVAPGSVFGAEFGFIHGDRRHRLVQLHHDNGSFNKLVLIREFRSNSDALELPPLDHSQLRGHWSGIAATISADWPEADVESCQFSMDLEVDPSQHLTWMADGGYHLAPRQVSHRDAFEVEAGWLSSQERLERVIRRYDARGAWLSATQIIASRA